MLNLIVAVDNNNVIGKGTTLPFRQRVDMVRFKDLTENQTVVMGKETFLSINRCLPNRVMRVLSNTLSLEHPHYVRIKNTSLDKGSILNLYRDMYQILAPLPGKDIFVIGGAQLYRTLASVCDRMYLTRIHAAVDGDIFFNPAEFGVRNIKKYSTVIYPADSENEYPYSFEIWDRLGVETVIDMTKYSLIESC